LGNGEWDITKLHLLLEKITPDHGTMDDHEVEHVSGSGATKIVWIVSQAFIPITGRSILIEAGKSLSGAGQQLLRIRAPTKADGIGVTQRRANSWEPRSSMLHVFIPRGRNGTGGQPEPITVTPYIHFDATEVAPAGR
jgi:hypothetical protein